MSEKVKEELKVVMNGLLDGMMNEAMKEHHETVKALVEEYGDGLLNPEHYHLYVSFKQEKMERVLMRTLMTKLQMDANQQFTSKQQYSIQEVYMNYNFYESQIRRVIEEYEGNGCCADKSRFLLKAYIEHIKTGVLPDFGSRSNYWIPMFGSPKAWMEVLSRCGNLECGQFDYYKEARDVLIEEVEQGVLERLTRLDELLTAHPNFTKKEEVNSGKQMTSYYYIQDEADSYFRAQIVVYPKDGLGYRCHNRPDEAEEGRLGYGDEKPEWFNTLIKKAN